MSRTRFKQPVMWPAGAALPTRNQMGNEQTQSVPSAPAVASIFSTQALARDAAPMNGIFQAASDPSTATAIAGPTADAGAVVSEAAATGAAPATLQAAIQQMPAWAPWAVFGVLSWLMFGRQR